MKDILIINTGGTFNKKHNRFSGNREIITGATEEILSKSLINEFVVINIIQKDSLDFTKKDRKKLYNEIKNTKYKKIIIIHGTDTIDISSAFIDNKNIKKRIVFTGAMTPYWENSVEATGNLMSAITYLSEHNKQGVYISLNGVNGKYTDIKKDRVIGKFIKLK